eukprot:2535795-Alexandrium_andersonii.AAC.1
MVGPGFDKIRASYGKQRDLALEDARGRLKWLLEEALRPHALHAASPCRRWSALGRGSSRAKR